MWLKREGNYFVLDVVSGSLAFALLVWVRAINLARLAASTWSSSRASRPCCCTSKTSSKGAVRHAVQWTSILRRVMALLMAEQRVTSCKLGVARQLGSSCCGNRCLEVPPVRRKNSRSGASPLRLGFVGKVVHVLSCCTRDMLLNVRRTSLSTPSSCSRPLKPSRQSPPPECWRHVRRNELELCA
jgi:hypothetical protein